VDQSGHIFPLNVASLHPVQVDPATTQREPQAPEDPWVAMLCAEVLPRFSLRPGGEVVGAMVSGFMASDMRLGTPTLDSLDVTLIALNLADEVVHCNSKACQVLSFGDGDVGMPFVEDFVGERKQKEFGRQLKAAREGVGGLEQVIEIGADEPRVEMQAIIAPWYDTKNPKVVMGTLITLTEKESATPQDGPREGMEDAWEGLEKGLLVTDGLLRRWQAEEKATAFNVWNMGCIVDTRYSGQAGDSPTQDSGLGSSGFSIADAIEEYSAENDGWAPHMLPIWEYEAKNKTWYSFTKESSAALEVSHEQGAQQYYTTLNQSQHSIFINQRVMTNFDTNHTFNVRRRLPRIKYETAMAGAKGKGKAIATNKTQLPSLDGDDKESVADGASSADEGSVNEMLQMQAENAGRATGKNRRNSKAVLETSGAQAKKRPGKGSFVG